MFNNETWETMVKMTCFRVSGAVVGARNTCRAVPFLRARPVWQPDPPSQPVPNTIPVFLYVVSIDALNPVALEG